MLDDLNTLKTEFKTEPNVLNVAMTDNEPVNIISGYSMHRPDMQTNQRIMVNANVVDEEFVKATGLEIIAGTDFTLQDMKDVSYDDQEKKTYHYILNESAAKELGWKPDEAIGKKMFLGEHRPGTVRAVIRDFHFSSFYNPIKPLVLFNEAWGDNLLVKLSGNDIERTIYSLGTKWKNIVSHRPFEYSFLDESYNKLYDSELRLGKLLNIFATVAILLAVLGLFGLSAYAIQQRVKEIGIRKIFGASVPNLVTLLSKDFLKLVAIASLIAFPIAWLVMNKWLEDFAYRVNIPWWIFLVAGLLTLIIALLTVSFQAIKAAFVNPVKNLRAE